MRLLGLFFVGVLLCAAQSTAAAVVIMPSDISRDTLLAWGAERPVLEPRDNPYTTGPVALGDGVFYSATTSNALLGFAGTYNFTGNGSWQGNVTPMTGVNAAQGSVSFTFATPVSAIIAQTNWAAATGAGGAPVTVSIFNDADVLMKTLVISDGKVDFQKAGSYLGFIHQNADIAKITFSNGFLGARDFFTRYGSNSLGGDWDGDGWNGGGDNGGRPSSSPPIDGPTGGEQPPIFQPGAVPEPSTWALMLFGFGTMGAMLRRSRRGQAALA